MRFFSLGSVIRDNPRDCLGSVCKASCIGRFALAIEFLVKFCQFMEHKTGENDLFVFLLP